MLAQPAPDESHELFEALLPTIDLVLRGTSRRRRLSPDEGDEFRSFVYRRLLDNQCSILHKYRGKSSRKTYLTVVIQRLLLDFRDHQWGKWRPSARAKAAGEVGILLDRLLNRDGHGVAEAVRIMKENHRVATPEKDLHLLAAELPRHGRPTLVREDALAEHVSADRAEAGALAKERADHLQAVLDSVKDALRILDPEDQLIFRMRFFDEIQICQIARTLRLPAKPLYRRVQRILRQLRQNLEGQRCFWDEIAWLFQP